MRAKAVNRIRQFVIGFLALPLAGGLCAQEQPRSSAEPSNAASRAQDIDPSKRADILHLLDLMGVKTAIARMAPTLLAQMEQFSHDAASSAQQQRIMQDTMARIQARIDSGAFEDLYVSIYDKYFTADDIRQLIRFYDSPVGRKFVDMQADITKDVFAVSVQWIQEDAARIKSDAQSKPAPEAPAQAAPPQP